MKKLRIFSLLLVVSIVMAASACSNQNSISDTTGGGLSESIDEPIDTLRPTTSKSYDGREFCIVTTDDLGYIYALEQNGSTINDTMYERDRKTEAELDVKIRYHIAGANIRDVFPAVQASVMANDSDYDLIVSHVNWDLTSYVSENIVLDWNTIPYVDFDKPYWNNDIIDSLSINGKSPYAASDIFMGNTVFLLYNKQLAESMRLGSLYDHVYSGDWTWDKLSEISAAVMSDINGDGKFDETDRYGVAISIADSSWLLRNIPASCGQFVYQNGSDGLTLSVDMEKSQSIIEKAAALFNGGGGYMIDGTVQDSALQAEHFNRGTYLTYFVASHDAANAYNNLDFDYGILPLPKYDSEQQQYYSLSWSHNLMVPVTADADFSGMVCEWMSYYGNRLVRPEFYDSLLSVRFAQDEESVDMLNIIYDNIVYDPGMNFKSAGFYGYFDGMVKSNNTNFTSYYQSKLSAEQGYIESLNDAFASFGG